MITQVDRDVNWNGFTRGWSGAILRFVACVVGLCGVVWAAWWVGKHLPQTLVLALPMFIFGAMFGVAVGLIGMHSERVARRKMLMPAVRLFADREVAR